jgi:hypothetical protein
MTHLTHLLWLVYTGGCGTDTSCLVIYIPFAGGMWFWGGTLALTAWAIEGVQRWWWLRA